MKIGSFQLFPERLGMFPLIWLLYLFFPVFGLLQERPLKMAVGYVLLIFLVVTYRQLYFAEKSFSQWLGLQLGIILLLGMFYSPYFLLMGFYPANFIGWYTEKRTFFKWYGLFLAVLLAPVVIKSVIGGFVLSKDYLWLGPMFMVMIFSPLAISSMNKKERALNEANKTIEELVKREERQRIARDLHDTLGHTLSMITLKSQLIEKMIDKDPDRAKREVRDIQQTSRSVLQHARELVAEMRVTKVTEALKEAERILGAANIRFVFEGDPLSSVSLYQQNVISMCLKEAVTNVIKHSQATKCRITINKTKGDILVLVSDNGVGTPRIQGAPLYDAETNGSGITGMRERLEVLEGTLDIVSQNGTTVKISIPIVMKESEDVVG